MRNFNWETLPKHTVVGKHNIWTADQADGDYELDTDHMEELFSNKQLQKKLGAVKRQSLRGLSAVASGAEMVSVNGSRGGDIASDKCLIESCAWGNSFGPVA